MKRPPRSQKRHLTIERLIDYREHVLPFWTRWRMVVHIRTCKICSEMMAEQDSWDARLGYETSLLLDDEIIPDGLRDRAIAALTQRAELTRTKSTRRLARFASLAWLAFVLLGFLLMVSIEGDESVADIRFPDQLSGIIRITYLDAEVGFGTFDLSLEGETYWIEYKAGVDENSSGAFLSGDSEESGTISPLPPVVDAIPNWRDLASPETLMSLVQTSTVLESWSDYAETVELLGSQRFVHVEIADLVRVSMAPDSPNYGEDTQAKRWFISHPPLLNVFANDHKVVREVSMEIMPPRDQNPVVIRLMFDSN